MSFLFGPLNILGVSHILLFIHTLKDQISILALIIPIDMILIRMIFFGLVLELCLEPDPFIPLVLHVSVIMLVDLLDIDGFVLLFDFE